jgi:hypothetical protein
MIFAAKTNYMRLITKEEKEKMPLRGRGGSSLVFRNVIELEPGQILFIEPQDWQRKHPPTTVVHYIERKYKRKFSTLYHATGQGWVVERLK